MAMILESVLLSFADHNRAFFGLELVYPVVSRRAGGVSIGVNLNPNNACNWACEYCQVPELTRGKGPVIAIDQLARELTVLLDAVAKPGFMESYVPPELRVLRDIAFSGNGEPTSSRQFPDAMGTVLEILRQRPALQDVKVITITNGTYGQSPAVREALSLSAQHHGEVWFKIDRGASEDIWQVNHVHLTMARIQQRLAAVSSCCPTWVQTCMTRRDGLDPTLNEVQHYLDFMEHIKANEMTVEGILLYTLARPSHQPMGEVLEPAARQWLDDLAEKLRRMGWQVRVF